MFQFLCGSGVPRGGGGSNPSPPKFRRPSKIVPNSTRLRKLLKIVEFIMPTPQDVWKKGSKILKLPKGKGKSVPLQAWSGPEGSRKLRFPDFMTMAQDSGKVVSLTHRPPLSPGNAPGTHFC